jgi:hypothetical protein
MTSSRLPLRRRHPGVAAAAERVKQRTAPTARLRYQFSFASLRRHRVEPVAGDCECRAA